MTQRKRGWSNPAKIILPHTAGKCPFCRKHYNNLEEHFKDKHRGEKISEELKEKLRLKY